MISQWIWFTD